MMSLPFLSCLGTGDAEAVVGVLELGRNARACSVAAYLDMVAPGTSSRSAPFPVHGALRVPLWRVPVVIRVVPVRAPFVNVVAYVVKSVGIWCVQAYWFRTILPALGIIGKRLGRRISPRISRSFHSPTGGAFPLGLGRQAIMLAGPFAQPTAIGSGFLPRYGGHGHFRVIKIRVGPERRSS